MLEVDKIIFKRATFASVITSAYPMIVVGCYFGITPWNMNRLSIDETDWKKVMSKRRGWSFRGQA